VLLLDVEKERKGKEKQETGQTRERKQGWERVGKRSWRIRGKL
jgi:hypothetical protein